VSFGAFQLIVDFFLSLLWWHFAFSHLIADHIAVLVDGQFFHEEDEVAAFILSEFGEGPLSLDGLVVFVVEFDFFIFSKTEGFLDAWAHTSDEGGIFAGNSDGLNLRGVVRCGLLE
jgi:hypothetical protein